LKFNWKIIKNKYCQKQPTSNYTTETVTTWPTTVRVSVIWPSDTKCTLWDALYISLTAVIDITILQLFFYPAYIIIPYSCFSYNICWSSSSNSISSLWNKNLHLLLSFHGTHLQWSTITGYIKSWFTESQFHGIHMTGTWDVP
jgi:hypothetical protein